MEVLQHEIPLDELKLPFHFALGSGLLSIDPLDAQAPEEILILCLSMESRGPKLAPPIGEDGLGQSPMGKGLMKHHEDIDLVLVEEPAARQEKTTMVIGD